jgi:hypothetical protein
MQKSTCDLKSFVSQSVREQAGKPKEQLVAARPNVYAMGDDCRKIQ